MEDAWRQAAKTDKMFLVEGAPDCMRLQSIGVLNTVAALGSAWNKDHFALIKKNASKVCFLPDDDPPKRGEHFGHGVQVVFEAGKLAMECGLSVSLAEIPDIENAHKQDPDTFYQNMNVFRSVEEVDFILWRAQKAFRFAQTTEEQRVVVREIAYLLTLIDDPTGVSMYVDKLSAISGKKGFWKEAINAEKKRIEEEEKRERGEAVDDLYKRFGFYVENGKYFSITEKGNVYEWSNFTMEPLFHIKDNLSPKRLYTLTNELHMKVLIELNQEDLVSISKFKQKIEGQGNFIWKATERELTKLKSFLYEKRKRLRKSSRWAGNVRAFMLLAMGCSSRISFTRLMIMALYVCPIWAIITCLLHRRYTKMMPGFSRLKSSLCISTTLPLRWKSLPHNFSRCLAIMDG